MASRTKSFFDSDAKNKQRYPQAQWKWKRNASNRPVLSEAPTNAAAPPPPPPPIPATAEAKAKLKAFQFVAGDNSNNNNNNNNNNNTPPSNPHVTAFPCTPGARLPLADLIGDCDATVKEVPVEPSPQEHIGWIPNSSNELLTPNRRRKRKRAKSSSPPSGAHSSSQPCDGLTPFQDRASMRTPAADPTADLWQRYNGLKPPEISSLAFNRSPRPLETPVKGGGGLRRWVSTGNDWPSSKHKKRCLNGRASINVWQDQTGTDSAAGKSRVASMVQRIQESLATQRMEQEQVHDQNLDHDHDPEQEGDLALYHDTSPTAAVSAEAPHHSSPLPETDGEPLVPPVTAKTNTIPAKPQSMAPPAKIVQSRVPHSEPRSPTAQLQRTDSGGMSVRSMGDPLHPLAAARLHLQSKAPLPAYKRPSITKPPPQPSAQQPAVPPPVIEDLDEFGDAFELDEDDLTELLSQKPLQQRSLYDIPEHPNPPPSRPVLSSGQGATQRQPITLDDDNDDDDDGDEFGDDDLDVDSFAQAEFSATQAFRTWPRKRKPASPNKSNGITVANTPIQSSSAAARLQRYVVKQVVDNSEYTNPKNGRRCEEKVLIVEDVRTQMTTAISLRGSWTSTVVTPKNVVHITHLRRQTQVAPRATPPGQIVVDDDETSPFLILHPDQLLSATTVADSFDCIRKAVLQDRIKATGEGSKAMVYGSILHEVFQLALSANRWDAPFLKALVERTIESHLEGLWELGMGDTGLAREEMTAKMGELSAWAGIFVAEHPGAKALVDERQGEKVQMSVSKLIAIEEHVWSPRFGLKGNIDATVQTTLAASGGGGLGRGGGGGGTTKLIAPLEVKTGRTTQSPAHMAQTALYTLLLSDRYDVDVASGILYYLESSAMVRVKPPVVEMRAMVQQRNRVAGHIFSARNPARGIEDLPVPDPVNPTQSQTIEESGLPQLLRNPFKCGRCYARQSCFTFHALVENGTADSAGMVDDDKKRHGLIWDEAVGHLGLPKNAAGGKGDVLKKWFTKWDRLLTFEEGDQARLRKELWTMTSAEREAAGRCFGELVLQRDLTVERSSSSTITPATTETVDGVSGSGGKINRFTYVFARAVRGKGASFAEGSALTVGEAVVVSGEQGQWALANGYVTAVSGHDITVAVDRKLGGARHRLPGFDEGRNQCLRGTMSVGEEDVPNGFPPENFLYRLDKDEFSNGLALIRNNLIILMSDDPIHTKLRHHILFNEPPTFDPPTTPIINTSRLIGEMNDDQRSAVTTVLAARDYALILGMPGTGKTTTIAHIIAALLGQGKSILLTSFTHTAVDNILLKIRAIAPVRGVLRIGVPSKINPQVQKFCLLASTARTSFEAIEDAYMKTDIVATTCMGTNHAVFQRRTFDVCIVDEASQITLPTILGPLLRARKFVLVGDHHQLPPLVQNRAALEGGLDVSLFRQLSELQPGSVVKLGRQYRMCREIMSLSNELIYSGMLRCGNQAVAERELEIPNPGALVGGSLHDDSSSCDGGTHCWLNTATDPKRKVVFLNTDPLGAKARESSSLSFPGGNSGTTITNPLEATLTTHVVLALLALGVPASEMGVITLYRSQIALLRRLFLQAGVDDTVEIDSADRFQGRDKEVIVLSMVRSNERGVVGPLLEDWRRVNVGFTRARSKFLVLGSKGTLEGNELLGRFLGIVEREGWELRLSEGADEAHGVCSESRILTPAKKKLDDNNDKKKMMMKKLLKESERVALRTVSDAGNHRSIVMVRRESMSSLKGEAEEKKKGEEEDKEEKKEQKKKKKKSSPKVFRRNASQVMIGGSKARKVKERVAVEIFEDLTGGQF